MPSNIARLLNQTGNIMTISKEQALSNLTTAKLKAQVAWIMHIDSNTAHDDHVRAETKYYAMREAYLECGILTWDETQEMRKYVITAVE
jgi:hypothetical protein